MRRLDRLLTIQRRDKTQDPESGQEIYTWVDRAHRREAAYRPLSGDERFAAAQWSARQQVEFELRYLDDVADVNPLDRIIYPAPDEANLQSPASHFIFDVIDSAEQGRQRSLKIKCARRAEIAS
jgi:SPP1 family predicted phage head-tail adaptor